MSTVAPITPRSAVVTAGPTAPQLFPEEKGEYTPSLKMVQLILDVAAVAAIVFLSVIKFGSSGVSGIILAIVSVLVSLGLLVTRPMTTMDSWLNTIIIMLLLVNLLCYKNITFYWLSIILSILLMIATLYAIIRAFLYGGQNVLPRMIVLLGVMVVAVYLLVTTIYY